MVANFETNITDPSFPLKDLSLLNLCWKKRDESLYGYNQHELVVPDELKTKLAYFPPIFKKTEVGRNVIGENKQYYANEKDLLKHPQRMLTSSFKLENGSIPTALFNFYMELGF